MSERYQSEDERSAEEERLKQQKAQGQKNADEGKATEERKKRTVRKERALEVEEDGAEHMDNEAGKEDQRVGYRHNRSKAQMARAKNGPTMEVKKAPVHEEDDEENFKAATEQVMNDNEAQKHSLIPSREKNPSHRELPSRPTV